jgi:hypothetical protein
MAEPRKPFEEGFAPDTTMDMLRRSRGNRTECDGCEQRRECVSLGDEFLCAECILARTVDHRKQVITEVEEALTEAFARAQRDAPDSRAWWVGVDQMVAASKAALATLNSDPQGGTDG